MAMVDVVSLLSTGGLIAQVGRLGPKVSRQLHPSREPGTLAMTKSRWRHHKEWPIDSAPSLGVYYFLSLTLSVCMSVCLSRSFKSIILLFLDGIEPFLPRHFSVWHSTKRCSSIFDIGPLTPKIWHKIAYRSACMADRPEMFGPTRGFSGMADSMEPYRMLWGRPLLPWRRHFR